MGYLEIILIGLGLSMDAVAVSAANGMFYKPNWKKVLLIAVLFGLFQGLMPLAGYYLGRLFSDFIGKIDHWLALILLSVIGTKMIIDGCKKKKADTETLQERPNLTIKLLILQSITVSIDALAVGISFVGIEINIFIAVIIIFAITTALCIAAAYIGKAFGSFFSNKATLLGGIILIAIGVKIFVEHMFF